MRIFKKLKKGFTLVELVVVIAVVAILAAVSVVSYIGVTNNAKKSNDATILAQVNRALVLRETNTEKQPKTMSEALTVLNEDLGVANVEKLLKATYSKYEFAYDLTANRFVLLQGEKIAECPSDYAKESTTGSECDFWKFSNNISPTDKYSHYCSEGYTDDIVTCSGVDTGSNEIENISFINESGNKNVVINTDGGSIIVDDNGQADITHYGEAGVVDIKKCYINSYHETGDVPFMKIKEGHLVISESANVNSVYIYNGTTYDKEGKIDQLDDSFENIVITCEGEQPKLSRSPVDIDESDGTKVCTVESNGESNDYYLFMEGVYEQVKITPTGESISGDNAQWADETGDENIEKAADQLANDLYGGYSYEVNEDTREITVKDENGDVVEEVDESVMSNGNYVDDVYAGSKFNGCGTENDPFLISDANEWYKMCTMYEWYPDATPDDWYYKLWYHIGNEDGSGVYVKITNDIDFTGWELPSETAIYNLHIDGNNKKVSNITSGYSLFCQTYTYYKYSDSLCVRGLTIKDLTFDNCSYTRGFGYYLLGGDSIITNVKFTNCSYDYGMFDCVDAQELRVTDTQFIDCKGGVSISYGSSNSSANIILNNVDMNNCKGSSGAYFYYTQYGTISFAYCDATNMNISGGSNMAVGGFIGNSGATVTIDNCSIGGAIVSTIQHVSGFVGQSMSTTITNSTVLAGTYVRNLLNGGTMAAFGGGNTATSENGNKFYGIAQTTNIANCSGITFVAGENWIQHKPIVNPNEVLTLSDDGTITYTGDDHYGSVKFYQTLNVDKIGSDNVCISGGYPWAFSNKTECKDVSHETVIGQLPYITGIKCIVTDANEQLHYSTKDASIIEGAQFADDYYGTYVKDGIAIIDSRPYSSGKYYCIAGCENASAPTIVNVAVILNFFDNYGALTNAATMGYTVNLVS